MKHIHLFILGICLAFVQTSCVINKPMGKASQPDYNQRQTVYRPSYTKKASPAGIGLIVGATAAGAGVGVLTEPIRMNTGEEANQPVAPANAAMGALVGFGVSSFFNHVVLKQGQEGIPANDGRLWLKKKYGKSKVFLRQDASGLTFIDRSAEFNYSVSDMADVRDYFTAFPDADRSNKEGVIAKAIPVVGRSSLPELLTTLRGTIHTQAVKEKYLELSNNLDQLYEAINRYPSVKAMAERRILMKTQNLTHLKKFNREYPSSKLVEPNLPTIANRFNRNDLGGVISMYPSHPKVSDFKIQYIKKSETLSEVISSTRRYPNLVDGASLGIGFVKTVADARQYMSTFSRSKFVKTEREEGSTTFYVGEFTNGKPNGYLVYHKQFDNLGSDTYEGNWSNGKRAGYGKSVMILNDYVHSKEGNFRDGSLNGKGVEIFSTSGSLINYDKKYEGSFFESSYSGQGTLTNLVDGYTYTGRFWDGQFNGQGTFTLTSGESSGEYYIGDFKNGRFHGKGKFYFNDGGWIDGNWRNGLPNGFCEERTKGGFRFKGNFKDGKKEGEFSVRKYTWVFGDSFNSTIIYRNGREISRTNNLRGEGFSDYSGSSYGDGGDIQEEPQEPVETDDCAGARTGNVNIPSYKANEWKELRTGIQFKKYIQFEDGISGNLFKNGEGKHYLIDVTSRHYYNSYSSAIDALYIYKKCRIITKKNQD